jgi:hypothetical protein
MNELNSDHQNVAQDISRVLQLGTVYVDEEAATDAAIEVVNEGSTDEAFVIAVGAGRKPRLVTYVVAEKSQLEIQTEIFAMASSGGDGALIAAGRQIRKMTAAERWELRQTLERLDDLMDGIALELHLARPSRTSCPQY